MKKRTFLKNLGLATGATFIAPSLLTSCSSSTTEEFPLWIWVGGDNKKTTQDWHNEFSRLKTAGIDRLLVGGGPDTLNVCVPVANELGMEIHAWVWVMNQPGNKETQAHPDWYAVSREGNSSLDVNPYVGYYQWLCPSKPEVQDYIYNRLVAHCDIPGLSGIQLDYVRYCDVILPRGLWDKYNLIQDTELPQFDFCYCDTCTSKFKAENGYDIKTVEDPTQDLKWRQYRWDSITSLVNRIAKGVHDKGKKISASVFATPDLARKFVRQSWDEWDLDFVFPMIYFHDYAEEVSFVEKATKEGVAALNGKANLYSALYFHELTFDELKASIAGAKAGRAEGMAFYANGLLTEEHAKVLRTL